jgi:hypothetical protein
MEADFAVDCAVIVEFSPSIPGSGVHFVAAFPSKFGRIGVESAIKTSDDASELELAQPITSELNDVLRRLWLQSG